MWWGADFTSAMLNTQEIAAIAKPRKGGVVGFGEKRRGVVEFGGKRRQDCRRPQHRPRLPHSVHNDGVVKCVPNPQNPRVPTLARELATTA